MEAVSSKTMATAALGRPFSLGMLYDSRKDTLIPGITLWDSDLLEKYIGERSQNFNNIEIVASDSLQDKTSVLSVEASLKASFFSGLVDIEGSAKYLHDDKTSSKQARMTLKYEATTKFQELSMDHLGKGNVKYPYVFDEKVATHVVTAILYGAQAFFVFDREVSDTESHQDIEGTLKVMINKIPSVGIEGSGSLKLDDKDIKKVEKFSCKFHGDFLLQETPSSYEGAVKVYKSLPTLLGPNGENAVPMKVWLLPLTHLDSTAAKLVREISATFIQDAQNVLEDFRELEMRCNDALRIPGAQQFPQIGKKIKTFKKMCSEFKVEFQKDLAKVLPSIRGGGAEEAVLAEILKKRHSSPFNNTSLNEWMDLKEREIYTVMFYTNMMTNAKFTPSQTELYKEVLSAEGAVCFVFTSLGSPEPYLSAMSDYLEKTPKPDNPQYPHPQDAGKDQWFTSKEVGDAMVHKAKLFTDFAEANKENKAIKFLTVGLTDETQKGSSIYLYKDGFSIKENFEPPSKPENVDVENDGLHSVKLEIFPPKFGAENVTSYSVEYGPVSQWEPITVSSTGPNFSLTNLMNGRYKFICRAVAEVGVSEATEAFAIIVDNPWPWEHGMNPPFMQ